jgi:xylan 1,4-beta-xylosidase
MTFHNRHAVLLIFVLAFQYATPSYAQKLVLQGAFPDPSVTKIGDTYWASATSSNWFPAFPIFSSKDLVNWQQHGYIFNQKPTWTEKYFWAPEMFSDSTRTLVFYTAKKKDGPLCIALATAQSPRGPYTDHGPFICQEYGSIDAFPIRDSTGKLYLVWKEDANSVQLPTTIWAQEFDADSLRLVGEKTALFRNDAPWEKELVEGVSIIRHGGYFYTLYAAAGCCGRRCTYVTGVARARALLGPWEKYNKNPILTDDSTWVCKGHGTPIEKDGKFYFLYHGYHRQTSAFTGREVLLQEFTFTDDGWIRFAKQNTDSVVRKEMIRDEFDGDSLYQDWQWNVFEKANYNVSNGTLKLFALPSPSGSFVGHKITTAEYTATTAVFASGSTAYAGIGAIGDQDNMVALLVKNSQLLLLKLRNGIDSTTAITYIPVAEKVYLRMSVERPYRLTFSYSIDGARFIRINDTPIHARYVAPWDSPPRAGLIAKGEKGEIAEFAWFEVRGGILKSTALTKEKQPAHIWLLVSILALVLVLLLVAIRWYKKKKARSG